MKNVKKIVCPIDLSEISKNTIEYALSFTRLFGVDIKFLHVSTKPSEVYYRFFPDVTGYLKNVEENVQVELKKFKENLNLDFDILFRYGTIYQEILQYTQDEEIDLIIIAAGSYVSSGHQLLLSTDTQKVIRKAECPVLTVYGKRTQADIKKILCPVDLSTRSYRALQETAILARKFNAKIYLIHIVELHEFEKKDVKKYSSDEGFSKFSELLKNEMVIPDDMQDIEVEKVVRRNIDAAAEINHFASEENIDLITLTTHGRGYWPRVLLGSVAEKILQIAPCPVLTIRVKK